MAAAPRMTNPILLIRIVASQKLTALPDISQSVACRTRQATTFDQCPLLDNSGQQWILPRHGLSAYDPKQTSIAAEQSATNSIHPPRSRRVKSFRFHYG